MIVFLDVSKILVLLTAPLYNFYNKHVKTFKIESKYLIL